MERGGRERGGGRVYRGAGVWGREGEKGVKEVWGLGG